MEEQDRVRFLLRIRDKGRATMQTTIISGLILLASLFADGALAAERKTAAGKTRPEAVYHNYCSVCHGDRGDGRSRARNNLTPPPRDFTAPDIKLPRNHMIAVTRDGKPGTAMVGWKTQLSEQEIAGVVDYIRTAFMRTDTASISGTSARGGRERDAAPAVASAIKADMSLPFPKALIGNRARGEKFYLANCATCHGAKGDGQGPRAYFIRPKPRNFIDQASRQMLNRPALYAGTAKGRLGAEMPAWEKVLTAQEIADVAEYVFTAYIQPPAAVATNKSAK